jgi:pimeloyl-ACP methyl ester carboxylesterase
MRDYPEGVRSVLIDSVVPLQRDVLAEIGQNGYRALERAFAACAENVECESEYPNPMAQLITVVADLNGEPAKIGRFDLTGDYFARLIFQLLYSPITIAVVPRLIREVADRDYDTMERLLSGEGGGGGGGISFGMHLSLHCAEEVPFTSAEVYDELDATVPEELRPSLTGKEYISGCEHWPVTRAPDSENEPVVSDVPTLVIAGYFDPITPPEFALAAQEFLTNSTFFQIDNESHGASLGDCGIQLGAEFFKDPGGPISSTCLDSLSDIEFSARITPPKRKIDFLVGPIPDDYLDRGLEDLKRRLR